MNTDCRLDPASEAQKAKLAFFGCTWDEGISYGKACDALDECARLFPELEAAYLNRPATEEQLATLLSLGMDPVDPVACSTFGQAERLISEAQTKRFWEEFNPIKAAIEKALMVTDDDLAAIDALKKKYDVQLTIGGNLELFRSVFLIELKNQLPDPIGTDLMMNDGEVAYFSLPCSWHQAARPAVPWETKRIADGVLFVTSERLIFSSGTKNTTIGLRKIVNCHLRLDCLKVEKTTGKPDLFAMSLVQARYALALVRALRAGRGKSPAESHGDAQGESYLARVRKDPATEKQKEKLRYFGFNFREGITKGQAHDTLDECVRRFPEKDLEYYNRPATAEQLATLRSFGKDPDEDPDGTGEPLTYGEAKAWISDCELESRESDFAKERAFSTSEAGVMEQELSRLNVYWPGAVREVTAAEFAQVWALVKSRKLDKSEQPQPAELIEALQELFPEFK